MKVGDIVGYCKFDWAPIIMRSHVTARAYVDEIGMVRTVEPEEMVTHYWGECSRCGCRFSLYELGVDYPKEEL